MSRKLYHNTILSVSDGMYRYALSIVQDAEMAKDVVQDCLTKIWSLRDELSQIEKVNAWAFRMVRNRCIDVLRSNKYTHIDEKVVSMWHTGTAEAAIVSEDTMVWVGEIIKTLPAKQQEIFHLREIEEMSYQEIAETCGITVSDVKVNIHRARKSVKAAMEKIEAYGIAN